MGEKYREAGVDIEAESGFVKKLISYIDPDLRTPGIFANYVYDRDEARGLSTDGVGNKLICYQEKGDVSDAGFDLLAAGVNDVASEFLEPFLFSNEIGLHKPDEKLAEEMGRGLSRAARESGVRLAGGETASYPNQIKEGRFLWGGTTYGRAKEKTHKERIEKRNNLRKGLYVVGIKGYNIKRRKYTLQSNGFALAMKLPEKCEPKERTSLIEDITVPSLILSPLMTELTYKNLVHFFAPITGSGYKNVTRVLPENLNAKIDFKINEKTIFDVIQKVLEVPEKEMYSVFNMGYVMTMGTDKPGEVIDIIIRRGFRGDEIGELKEGKGEVILNGINIGKYE